MEIRVFPRRTRATPTDDYAFIGEPGLFVPEEATRVSVSVTFSWDLPLAEMLARSWERTGLPISLGGPATGMIGGDFTPGRFLQPGYVITSRGCPNKCWFCNVWKRDGNIRELSIMDGWNILDDNLLACSAPHIQAVFAMLHRQKQPVEFTGGLEAKRLQRWHIDLLTQLPRQPKQIFFAYDEEADYEPLLQAGQWLQEAGFQMPPRSHQLRAYVLIGYPKDTIDQAEERLLRCYQAGFLPMAMLWRDTRGETPPLWRRFQRLWARPQIMWERVQTLLP